MLYQVDDALPHAMSGIELSRVRTELRLLPPEAYQQNSDRVERGRHCYAIMWILAEYRPAAPVPSLLVGSALAGLLDVEQTQHMAGHSVGDRTGCR